MKKNMFKMSSSLHGYSKHAIDVVIITFVVQNTILAGCTRKHQEWLA